MRNRFLAAGIFCLLAFSYTAQAQSIFPDQTGSTLLNSLASTYRPASGLNGTDARDRLYDTVDRGTQGEDDGVYCIYTDYFVEFDCSPSCDPSQDVYNGGSGINLEHSWPQSQGANSGTAQWDLHHLFPTRVNVNSARGNMPFGNSPDPQTINWYYLDQSQSNMPPENVRYLWSERGTAVFEPRNEMKGDIARAMFYFYTMYGPHGTGQANTSFFDQMIDTLLEWHVQDPPTADNVARSERVAQFQTTVSGTAAINPYVVDATLASRAFGSGEANPAVFFAVPSASVLSEDRVVEVMVSSFAVTETSTVTVAHAGGTAISGVDYEFSESTLTFGSGTTDIAVEIEILENPDLEDPVTVVLELVNPSDGLGIGSPSTFELTIYTESMPPPSEPLIAYWNFNDPASGSGEPNSWPQPVQPTSGSGFISYNFDTAGVTNFGGTDINVRDNDSSGRALAIQGLSGVNNGRYLDIKISTIGMEDVVLTYATRGTNSGFDSQIAEFSVDGGSSWTFIDEETDSRNTNFFLVEYELSQFPEVENQANVIFRITLDGSTSDVGNNRFDNITVEGTKISTSQENQPEASIAGLQSVWPNPVQGMAFASFTLGETSDITLELFDTLGRSVSRVAEGTFSEGPHEISFNTNGLANGIYLLRMTSTNGISVKRITVID